MRLKIGAIPETPDTSPDVLWRPLREPTPIILQLWALPLGILAAVLVGIFWVYFTPLPAAWLNPVNHGLVKYGIELIMRGSVLLNMWLGLHGAALTAATYVLVAALSVFAAIALAAIQLGLLIPVHELFHAAVHPHFGLSENSILGIWPAKGVCYAHYTGELSRSRVVAIYSMPFLAISLSPLLLCAITARSSGLLAVISILNALASCVDMLAIGLILFQIPANATVRNNGWKTSWRAGG